jgi:hypothetical protein
LGVHAAPAGSKIFAMSEGMLNVAAKAKAPSIQGPGWSLNLGDVQEAGEFLMAMALNTTASHAVVEDVRASSSVVMPGCLQSWVSSHEGPS